jgi:hypothetical protein
MRNSTFAVAMILLAVVAWFGLQGSPPRAADPPADVHKFEYKTTIWRGETEATINALGAEGWELCGVVPEQHAAGAIVIFKRPSWNRTPPPKDFKFGN